MLVESATAQVFQKVLVIVTETLRIVKMYAMVNLKLMHVMYATVQEFLLENAIVKVLNSIVIMNVVETLA